jgi:type I restriction enzyme S subunit
LTPKEVTALDTKIVFDTERKITQQGLDSCSTKIMPEKSVLLTSRATVGDVVVNREPMGTNQGFICIQPNDRVKPYYFSCLIENNRPEIESRASGSTYDEISQTSFNEIEVAVPPKEDIENFESKIEDIYEDIYTRELENRNLSSLKEALLPKLMSGEVRVNDINLEDLEVGSEV